MKFHIFLIILAVLFIALVPASSTPPHPKAFQEIGPYGSSWSPSKFEPQFNWDTQQREDFADYTLKIRNELKDEKSIAISGKWDYQTAAGASTATIHHGKSIKKEWKNIPEDRDAVYHCKATIEGGKPSEFTFDVSLKDFPYDAYARGARNTITYTFSQEEKDGQISLTHSYHFDRIK